MAHYTTARFDERDFSFLPPTRTVGFNPLLKINDSLLAQSYVEAYDISYPEALCRIEQETEEMKQILEREGKYELKDLGTLFINDEGHYTFEPCEAGLLTPALYGLSCFELKRLDAATKSTALRFQHNRQWRRKRRRGLYYSPKRSKKHCHCMYCYIGILVVTLLFG